MVIPRKVPELSALTMSYWSEEVDHIMLLGIFFFKSGARSVTTVEPTAYNKTVGDFNTHIHADKTDLSRTSDDAQSHSLDDHFELPMFYGIFLSEH